MKTIDRMLQRWRISKARPYISPGARVLDIGCADGALFRYVFGIREGLGVDPDLEQDEVQLPNAVLLKGFFPEALPDERPFDVITMLAVLEHVPPDRQRILAEQCARYLKPEGYLIITVPSPTVDSILAVLRFLRLIHGMALEQHYGFDPRETPAIFGVRGMELVEASRFQLQLNNLFVFRKIAEVAPVPARTAPFASVPVAAVPAAVS
jgi:SAM-dependent methyltransferase